MDSRWDWILFTVPKVTRTKFGALPEVLGNRPYSERDSIIKCLKKKRRTTVRYLLSWADFLAKENTFHKYLTCSVEFCISYHIWKWNVRVRVEIDGTLSQKHVCLRGQRHFKKRCLSRFFKVNILPSWKTGTVLVDRVFFALVAHVSHVERWRSPHHIKCVDSGRRPHHAIAFSLRIAQMGFAVQLKE